MNTVGHTLATWLNARRFTRASTPKKRPAPQALQAADLNRALSVLHQAQGTYSQADFLKEILPMYQRVMAELIPRIGRVRAEAAAIALMEKTARACHRAAHTLLPIGRLGTDYRQVEIAYTDALVTAMAVECVLTLPANDNELPKDLRKDLAKDRPEDIAVRLIPASVLSRLRADPVVWQDWLGFFMQSPTGGLYALSREHQTADSDRHTSGALALERNAVDISPRSGKINTPKQKQKPKTRTAAGWQVVDGIKTCLADGTLSFNQPGDLVQVDAQGRTFLQAPAVFEAVKVQLGWEEGARKLENRFLRLNITRCAPGGWKRFRGKSLQSEPMVQGYVIQDGRHLWGASVPTGRFVVQDVTSRV